MKVCIPALTNNGLESTVCGHFGSAPFFILVNTDDLSVEGIVNNNAHHAHGTCQPLAAIAGHKVDAVVVGGIGGGALAKLTASGIRVFKAEHPTVKESVDAIKQGSLSPVDPHGACRGHHHSE